MRKPVTFLLAAIAAVSVWMFFQTFEIEGIHGLRVKPRGTAVRPAGTESDGSGARRQGNRIRIASFNVQPFGDTKADKPHVMDILARIARQFDIVAIQGIQSRSQDLVPRLVDLINMTGHRYDFVVGPRVGRTSSLEQFAFIFDQASVEVDRDQLYSVEDPDDLLDREPLVAWFRSRGPPAEDAFTFTLVNVHTDPEHNDRELQVLDDVFHAVRQDGRGEDDVIVLGNFHADDRQLGELGQISEICWAIANTPTNTRGTQQHDNLVFHKQATSESTGRSGVFDFLRQFNLTVNAADEVSHHMPVWAEFTIYEGGQPGRVAARPEKGVK